MNFLGSLANNMICVDEAGFYTAEGINALCEVLKDNNTLTSLKYATSLNTAQTFPPRALTAHNASVPSYYCSLRDNGLGPEGCTALAEGLNGNTTLRSLE